MKMFVRHAVTLVAISVACQAGLALAEDGYYWTTGNEQTKAPATAEKVVGQGNSCCPAPCCPEQKCGACDQCCGNLGCETDPAFAVVGSFGLDSFKGVADGSDGNFGVVTGVNTGVLIPGMEEYGLGWQTGITFGVYDFDGRATLNSDPAHAQQQTFVTTGFYRKASGEQRISFGLVYDWMYNTDYGVYGNNPTMGQWRGQIEYAMSDCNGIGVWGAKRDLAAVAEPFAGAGYTVTDRVISQVNLFWHHKFVSTCADSWLYVGLPDHGRLDQTRGNGGGSLGDWTVGASLQVPLSERLALYANGSYMHPSCAASTLANSEASYDVSMGVAWYFGGHARSAGLFGKAAVPYMPMANNSNFLVDQF